MEEEEEEEEKQDEDDAPHSSRSVSSGENKKSVRVDWFSQIRNDCVTNELFSELIFVNVIA